MTQDKFKEILKSKEIKEFSKKVANEKYDKIDWFKLETEIENICNKENFDLEKYSKAVEKILEDRFVKINKYVVKPFELNIVFEEILNELVDALDTDIAVNDFYVKEYEIESTIKNQVTKSINYLSSYGVTKKSKRSGNGVHYKTQSEFWNKKAQYVISDADTLKELVPIIISYIKNGNIKTYNIQTLFQKFSSIIEYGIMPALGHNSIVDTELEIIDACLNDYDIEIEYVDKNITIKPEKIVIIGSEKFVRYKENEKIIDISLKDLILLNVIDKTDLEVPLSTLNSNIRTLSSFSTPDKKEPKTKNVEVILECDTVVFEYFRMKPLKSMKTYATEDELKEFHQTLEIKPKDNKFYITASSDTEDMIISTVLHSLPHSKILEPYYLNDKLIQKFKDYGKDFIDICPPTEPTPNNGLNSSSNNEPKNEVIKDNISNSTNQATEKSNPSSDIDFDELNRPF